MDVNWTPVGVILMNVALSICVEILQWLVAYRSSSFKSMKREVEKYASNKKSGPGGNQSNPKNVRKREQRQQSFEQGVGKEMFGVQIKTGLVTMAAMIISLRIVPRIFGENPVARLPFEPPNFMLKATHRGIQGADPRDCSALFLFMLCQGCIRPIISKILGWGPSRQMANMKLTMAKDLKTA